MIPAEKEHREKLQRNLSNKIITKNHLQLVKKIICIDHGLWMPLGLDSNGYPEQMAILGIE